MDYRLVEKNNLKYVECTEGELANENDALDLVAACGEYETHNLLIHAASITPDFFQLQTGLAGAILLKFSNYHVKTALILAPQQVGDSGRFYEMVLEANRRNRLFHVFHDLEAAEDWLTQA